MTRTPDCYRLAFGPNVLEFAGLELLLAFAEEQGVGVVTYWPMWTSKVATT